MKRNNKLILILILLVTFTYSNVYAAGTAGLKGHVEYTSHPSSITNVRGQSYHWYTYTFKSDSGGSYRAYCTNPGLTGSKSINLSCHPADPSSYPMIYALATKHPEAIGTEAGDLALRSSGILDQDIVDRGGNDASNVDGWWFAVMVTQGCYRLRASDPSESNPKTKEYCDGMRAKGLNESGVVQQAMALVTEIENDAASIRARGANYPENNGAVGTPIAVGDGGATGKLVQLTPQSITDTSKTYTVTPVGGKKIETLTATATGTIAANLKWDAASQTGTLTVTFAGVNGSCEGSVIISAAAADGEGVGDTTTDIGANPSLYSCSNTSPSGSTQNFIVFGPSLEGDEFTFESECDCDDKDCGVVPGYLELKVVDVNNCCEPGAESVLAQYGIDDLYCYDKKVKVQNYKKKCGTEEYLEDEINEYCALYCSHTASYRLPGATASKNGRYFVLNNTREGVSGPTYEEYKRCRTLIAWDVWFKDYYNHVKQQVEGYNQHQENKAYQMVWEDLVAVEGAHKETKSKTFQCTATVTWSYTETQTVTSTTSTTNGTTGTTTTATTVVSKSGSATVNGDSYATGDFSIRTYAFSYVNASTNSKYTYNIAKLKSKGRPDEQPDPEYGTGYTELDVIYQGKKNPSDGAKYYHQTDWQKYLDKQNTQKTNAENSAKSAGNNYTLTGDNPTNRNVTVDCPAVENNPNPVLPENKISNYRGKKDAGGTKFNTNATDAKQQEKDLTICDKYGQDELDIEGEPEMDFRYTQAYINDMGKPQIDEIGIPFTKTCEKTHHHGAWLDGSGGAKGGGADNFSTVYLTGKDLVKDFASGIPDTLFPPGAVNNPVGDQRDGEYPAEKQFTTDDVVELQCKWDDSPTNTQYTLVPSGLVSETTSENYTMHEKEYHTVTTHYEGEFQTYFTLSNVAEGLFDEFVNNGTQCDGNTGNATCKIVVDNEDVETGPCNPVITKNSDLCNDCRNPNGCGTVKSLIEYREVDPANVFPNASSYYGKMGYNWLVDADGRAYLTAMQNNAARTYDPTQSLTYSFTFGPDDLRAIREYNKSRIPYGGYTDFNMDCEGVGSTGVVHRCYSRFLTAISNGKAYGSLSLDTSNNNIDAVRNSFSASEWR